MGRDEVIIVWWVYVVSPLTLAHIRSSSGEGCSVCGWEHFGVRSAGGSEETCLGQ